MIALGFSLVAFIIFYGSADQAIDIPSFLDMPSEPFNTTEVSATTFFQFRWVLSLYFNFSMCTSSKTPAVPLSNYSKPSKGKVKTYLFLLGWDSIVSCQTGSCSLFIKDKLVMILIVILSEKSTWYQFSSCLTQLWLQFLAASGNKDTKDTKTC